MSTEAQRELAIIAPLPEDTGLRGDGRPQVHRFRSHWLELGRWLREFRVHYDLTQADVARAVGATVPATVAQWERGTHVPDGVRCERLAELLAGRRWPALRAATLVGDGLPASWERAARWYRRASRERRTRDMRGPVVAKVLDELREVSSVRALRERYCAHDADWVRTVAERCGLADAHRCDVRRLEDAAYGLRWLELAGGLRLDLRRSLVPQVPLSHLGAGSGGAIVTEPVTDS